MRKLNHTLLAVQLQKAAEQIKTITPDSENKEEALIPFNPVFSEINKILGTETLESMCFLYVYNESLKGSRTDCKEIVSNYSLPNSFTTAVHDSFLKLQSKNLFLTENCSRGYNIEAVVPNALQVKIERLQPAGKDIKSKISFYGKIIKQIACDKEVFKFYIPDLIRELKKSNSREIDDFIDENLKTDSELVFFVLTAFHALSGETFNSLDFMTIDSLSSLQKDKELSDILSGEGHLFDSKILHVKKDANESLLFEPASVGIEIIFGKQTAQSLSKIANSFTTGTITHPKAIKALPLYFGDELNKEIKKIGNLILEEGYDRYRNRMTELGKNQGVSILLHGEPGTGKTELVMQYAKQSGRKIFRVETSSIKSKWIGESESNTKKIFKEYANMCASESITPILMFNEADSLISKRINLVSSADSISNTMQNILLEELEKFNGIFFATTNMIGNIDEAFDRRFLFKLKIGRAHV